MGLTRYFFTSSDLDDLERLEKELEAGGVVTPQIHLLTLDDAGADTHGHLHTMSSLMKKDIVRSGMIGAAVGIFLAVLVLVVSDYLGWTSGSAGWLPWVFLAVVVFGICTWEGGLYGIQTPNAHFSKFEERIRSGEHLFFVDIDAGHRALLEKAAASHSSVRRIGTGHASPSWFVFGQDRFKKLVIDTLP